ncbi:hypothetical protein CRM22_003660 [Opisthorchis felineus]|uniref:Uncharacterized protein n=1 Tax=Opisthorchis felineus TaxID=147828 RepID=A0A4V3SFS4_OPIFE|nr:hypothetical protein CRM22_003660 [Opisthorchis felineus]
MHIYLPKVSDMGQSIEVAVSKKPMETLVKDHLAKLLEMLIAVDAYGLLTQTHSCLEDASEGEVHKVFKSMFQAGKVHAQMELLTALINQPDEQTDFRLPLLALLQKQMDQIRKSLGDIYKRHLPLCSTPESNSPHPVFYKEIFTVKGLIESTFVALSELFNHMSLEYAAEDHSKIMKVIYSCLTTFDAFPTTLRELEKTCTAATETLDIVHWPFFELGELSAHQELISYYTVDSVVAGLTETSDSSGTMGSLDGVLHALTEELANYEDVLPTIALGQLPDLPSEIVKKIDRLETIIDKIGTLTPRPRKFQMECDY